MEYTKVKLERWRDCEAPFSHLYQISDRGNIRGKDRIVRRKSKGKFLQTGKARKMFWNNSKRCPHFMITFLAPPHKAKTLYVHLLVAAAFCKKPYNPENKTLYVIFKDGNHRNLNWWNLKYVMEKPNRPSVIPDKTIASIRKMYNEGYKLSEIERVTGFSISTMAPFIYNTDNSRYHNSRYKPKTGKKKRRYVSKRNARLTKTAVKDLRRQLAQGVLNIEIQAKKYGLAPDTIYRAANGFSWKSVK